MTTHYLLHVRQPAARRIEVELHCEARGAAFLDVRLPVWTPGSYLVREHQRHVDGLAATDEAGNQLPVAKTDKHTWRIQCANAGRVSVSYRLACHELTVRTNHVDPSHAFLNPSASCAFVVGREQEPCEVRLDLPEGWKTWVALPQRDGAFVAQDYDELVDSPFEAGPLSSHSVYSFNVLGKEHELVVWGQGDLDPKKVVEDIGKIIVAESKWFNGLPYTQPYLFILHLNDKGRGGLEHRHSCALLVPRFSFRSTEGYEDFLQLVAHEFFHLWNVKRLRPAAFTPYDWTQENHTGLLWAMEGLTRTYEIVALRRADLVDEQRYLELWAELITALRRTPGRLRTSLLQASYDAWVKFYRPDETTQNTTVSYYLKGGVVGLLLDLELRRRTQGTKSLDDVMRLLFERYGRAPGLPEDGVERAALEIVGEDPAAAGAPGTLKAWLDRALRSTEELQVEEALAGVGLSAVWHPAEGHDDKGSAEEELEDVPELTSKRGWHGAQVRDASGTLAVQSVVEGSPAQLAGLANGDDIAAIDGYRGELKSRLNKAPPGANLRLTIFRGDELTEAKITLVASPADTLTIVPDPHATALQLQLRRDWLGGEWPAPDGDEAKPIG